jgi:archaellin
MKSLTTLGAVLLAMLSPNAHGAPSSSGVYDPRNAFAPLTLSPEPSVTRSASGLPTSAYWQNRADYSIQATLDPVAKAITGEEVVSYTNNSPEALDVLWLQLDQNRYRADSRGNLTSGVAPDGVTTGITIDAVELAVKDKSTPLPYLVTDTRLRVDLPQPLGGKGGKMALRIRWHYTVPGAFSDRTAWGNAAAGEIFDIGQWYPRMAVYDDLRGWDTAPYLDQEFYLEYGDFDYWITAPSSLILAGSGSLQNPADVLTATQRQRLDQARKSDATVAIITPEEAGTADIRPKQGAALTWHFRMDNTRDVSFTASPIFAWDAARINLPQGKSALAMSLYPAEAKGDDHWGRSTAFVKDAVERYSNRWFSYPWPVMVNVAGPVGGMEYPGIVYEGINYPAPALFWTTSHEVGHSWFPMIVGFNERRDAWMDEGFNTFINVYQSDAFNQGEYAPKRDLEYAQNGGSPVEEILPVLADPEAPPIVSRADTIEDTYRHPVTYFKSALGLVLLREQILGPDRFDPAFRRFIAAWAYKHPTPADFFRSIESESGEDLSYWWRGWYLNNWQLDLAVAAITPADKDHPGSFVTVEARDKLIMPALLRVKLADGTQKDIDLPAETWIRTASTQVFVAGANVVSAELDPEHKLPDRDRGNNRLSLSR